MRHGNFVAISQQDKEWAHSQNYRASVVPAEHSVGTGKKKVLAK